MWDMYVCLRGNEREWERSGNDDKLMFSLGASLDGNIDQLLQCVFCSFVCFALLCFFKDIPKNYVCFQEKSVKCVRELF